ncbi:HlyD family secretion protein [Aurantivibrio plasticivorans]
MSDTAMSVKTVTQNQLKRFVFMVVVPLGVLVMCLMIYLNGGRYVETDNAYIKADIVPISARVAGTIDYVNVIENQTVARGDLLFRIDNTPFRVQVDKAQARLGEVEATLNALRSKYLEQQVKLDVEKENLAFNERELNRQRDLKGKNFVSESVMDDLEHAVKTSKQNLAIMRHDIDQIEAELGGKTRGSLTDHPSYQLALADLRHAEYELAHTEVRAPLAGVVSNIPKLGQFVREGINAAALVAHANIWIEANFPETDLTHVQVGQAVTFTVDSYPDITWKGEVESISPATGAEFAILPPQNATGNWVKIAQRVPVRVRIHFTQDSPPLRVGLSAVVDIDTGHVRKLLGVSL